MRTPLIAANWKMNTTLADAHVLADGIRNGAEDLDHVEIVLFPPLIWLTELAHRIPPHKLPHLKLGGQNVYYQPKGAFTGETSPQMVKEVAEYALIGHSERTHLFKEEKDLIHFKLRAAFDCGLKPILCIGEDRQEPDSKRTLGHLLDFLLATVTDRQIEELVVAYEPVWAIGSGNPATPEYAQEVIAALRHKLSPRTRILYGGSVSAENAGDYLNQPDIDGLLIGGMSLKLKDFLSACVRANDKVIAEHTARRNI